MAAALGSGVILFATPASGTMSQALTIAATGSNRMLIVGSFMYSSGGVSNISGITYNGVAMTAGGADYGTLTASGVMRFWYLANPGTGSAFNIVATIPVGSAEEGCLVAQAFNDVHQTVPFGTQVGTNGTNSTTSTGTVSISGSDLALALWTGYDAAGAYTITPNGTGIVEDENAQFNTTVGFQSRANGTLGWTHSVSVDSFQQLSIPLKDVSGGGGGGGVMRPTSGIGGGGMSDMNGGMQGRAHGRGRIVVPPAYMIPALTRGRAAPQSLRV